MTLRSFLVQVSANLLSCTDFSSESSVLQVQDVGAKMIY